MKVLHLEAINYPRDVISKLKKDFEFISHNEFGIANQTDLTVHLESNLYDIIFTRLGFYLDEKALSNQTQLKYIVTPTTGLNHINLDYTNKKSIRVISLKGESLFLNEIQSTSEHVWALILSLTKNIINQSNRTKNLKWGKEDKSMELNGRTIGIIGFGRLGKIISKYAKAFSMNVLINDINLPSSKNISLDNLLKTSDIIVLLIDYRKENENFIDKHKFSLMKDGVIFINCSRGELINEDDLLVFLNNSKIKGCGLDVLKNDSKWINRVPLTNKLIKYSQLNDNLIITPHIGGYSDTSIYKTREFIVKKLYNKLDKIWELK